MVFGMGFAAVSLGVARATLDAAIELARGKTPSALKAMRENNAVQGLIGRTEGNLRAARAYLYATPPKSGAIWRDRRASPTTHRIALRLASTWTIHQAASVVDTAYHMAGATAVFSANRFERRFRDMHAIAQQIQARDTHYEDVGKAILPVHHARYSRPMRFALSALAHRNDRCVAHRRSRNPGVPMRVAMVGTTNTEGDAHAARR
jgi:alkylation response protein AidB-like acyl-CoA dehydrogenase